MFYDLMGVEREAMKIYVDAWGIKRLISFLIRRFKAKTTSGKPKDGLDIDFSLKNSTCKLYTLFICTL